MDYVDLSLILFQKITIALQAFGAVVTSLRGSVIFMYLLVSVIKIYRFQEEYFNTSTKNNKYNFNFEIV